MKQPSDFELGQFLAHIYDPQKAHDYYEKHKKLKGRKPRQGDRHGSGRGGGRQDPRAGKTRSQITKDARAKQRKELAQAIQNLEQRLKKLEALIKKRSHAEKSEDRKSKAKKERAAKEHEKPKTAAEKAKAARESEKYRDKHKQKLKNEAKKHDDKSGGGSSKSKTGSNKKHSVEELQTLATRVKGQLAIAKQKLAAL